MSVAGIFSSAFASSAAQIFHRPSQNFQQEFQQLGQDLQSGNLAAAQTDFATLQQLGPQAASSTATQNTNPIAQAFQQLSQDLQSGNLSAAQQAFAQIQQDFQNDASGTAHAHHHHHHSGGEGQTNSITQLFQQLGQDLQSGNLSAAQQAYSTLSQDLPSFGSQTAPTGTTSPASASGISVTA
jgi:hypothetical protein